MAKAQFHKHQRVYVKPVGTWSVVEQIVPQWARNVEEPVRILYDVGLGRDFAAEELEASESFNSPLEEQSGGWRVIRGANKWTAPDASSSHPYPGTHPIIVTGPKDWGGWRVPGAEYDLDPERVENQARIMANAIRLLRLMNELVDYADEAPETLSNRLLDIAHRARGVIADTEAA